MSREEALTQLAALGVPLGQSGDVAELKRATLRASRPVRVYSAERQCKTKIKYTSFAAAHKALRRIENVFVRPYGPCFHCGGWHNGNPPRSRGGR